MSKDLSSVKLNVGRNVLKGILTVLIRLDHNRIVIFYSDCCTVNKKLFAFDYLYIFAAKINIHLKLDLSALDTFFSESSVIGLVHNTVVIISGIILALGIHSVIVPDITAYNRCFNLCKSAVIIQKSLSIAHIIVEYIIILIRIFYYISISCHSVGVFLLTGNDYHIIAIIVIAVLSGRIAVLIIIRPIITYEIILHTVRIVNIAVFGRTIVRILLILGYSVILIQFLVFLRIYHKSVTHKIHGAVIRLVVVGHNILENVWTWLCCLYGSVFSFNVIPFAFVIVIRLESNCNISDTLFKGIHDTVVILIVPDPVS